VITLHALHLARLSSFGLGEPGRVAALGGGARDHRMVQLLATMLGHPVQRCGDDETGARGAALLAAQSQGASADVLPAPADLVEPDEAAIPAHQAFRADFNALLESLQPAFVPFGGARA
jgi:L-xylulokinase